MEYEHSPQITRNLCVVIPLVVSIITITVGILVLINYGIHKDSFSLHTCEKMFIIGGSMILFLLIYYLLFKIIIKCKKNKTIHIQFNNNDIIKQTKIIKPTKINNDESIFDNFIIDDDENVIIKETNKPKKIKILKSNDNISIKSDDIMIDISKF
jgi:hypothetical protein